jgi:hypothetical protein
MGVQRNCRMPKIVGAHPIRRWLLARANEGLDLEDFHMGVAQRHYVADLFAH